MNRKEDHLMDHNITPALAAAFTQRVAAMGYTVETVAEDMPLFAVYRQGTEICKFETSGDMRYYADNPLADNRRQLYDLMCEMKEIHDLYAQSEPLNCVGKEHYRLISACGDYLLAAKLGGDNEIHFTTWAYNYDHTGVEIGHYYDLDYRGAARDFALRAGLVDKRQLFTWEELAVLYGACVYRDRNDKGISCQDEQKLQTVMEKVRSTFLASAPQRGGEQEENVQQTSPVPTEESEMEM